MDRLLLKNCSLFFLNSTLTVFTWNPVFMVTHFPEKRSMCSGVWRRLSVLPQRTDPSRPYPVTLSESPTLWVPNPHTNPRNRPLPSCSAACWPAPRHAALPVAGTPFLLTFPHLQVRVRESLIQPSKGGICPLFCTAFPTSEAGRPGLPENSLLTSAEFTTLHCTCPSTCGLPIHLSYETVVPELASRGWQYSGSQGIESSEDRKG